MDSKLANNIAELEKMFSSRMCEYEDKLQKATSGGNPLHVDLDALSKDFTGFKSFVCQTLCHLRTQIELISLSLDHHETTMRRKVLLFHGIPEKANENLCVSVHNVITKQMKLSEVGMDSFDACHRLGGSEGKTRPVLVRFLHMEHRRLVWDSKTSMKGSGITISEFLTKSRHGVFIAARKHFSIRNCWSTEGKIVILTPDKSRRKIVSMGELRSLMVQFPASRISEDDSVNSEGATSPKASTPKATAKAKRKARR